MRRCDSDQPESMSSIICRWFPIYYYFSPSELFTQVITNGFPLNLSLLRSSGLFSVSWPITTVLFSGWSRFFSWFPILHDNRSNHTHNYWYHHCPRVAQIILVLLSGPSVYLSFGLLLFSICGLSERQNPLDRNFFLFR